jgi:hypothetical protein
VDWAIIGTEKVAANTPASATRVHRLIMKYLLINLSPPAMVTLVDYDKGT